jgi:hypothetical protein
MHGLAAAFVFAIPVTVLATVLRLLSIEYALGIVWAAVLLLIALGLSLATGLVAADASR